MSAPSIAQAERAGAVLPLTPAQREVWIACQLGPMASCAYNWSLLLELEGLLRRDVLAECCRGVVARHEALRVGIEAGGERQVLAPHAHVPVEFRDLAPLAPDAARLALDQAVIDEVHTPFDLARPPLLRATLFRLAELRHALLLTTHHSVADGWSGGVVAADLAALYAAATTGAPLPPAPPSFVEHARRTTSAEALAHATRSVADSVARLKAWPEIREAGSLPADFAAQRASPTSRRGSRVRVPLREGILAAAAATASGSGATLFSLLLAATYALIARLTARDVVLVGVPVLNRELPRDEQLVAHCANVVPLAVGGLDRDPRFADLLASTQEEVFDANERGDAPLSEVARALGDGADARGAPLVRVTLALERAGRALTLGDGIRARTLLPQGPRPAPFDVDVSVIDGGAESYVDFTYSRELFANATVTRWVQAYTAVLETVVADPDVRLSALGLLDEGARRRVLAWSRGQEQRPATISLAEAFERRARETPDAEALVWRGGAWSYGELNRRANALASILRARDVGPDSVVGVCLPRSPQLVLALLAVAKAGGAYLPLDPGYPPERLKWTLADAGARVVVGEEGTPSGAAQLVVIEPEPAGPDADPPPAARPENLAYVMYTSGSTGRPKGVGVTNANVLGFVAAIESLLAPPRTVLHYAPSSFDASTFEIWGALLHGCRLAVAPAGVLSLAELGAFVLETGCDTAWFTAALFHKLVERELETVARLRDVFTGGDVVSATHVTATLEAAPALRVYNAYGPTETTTFASVERASAGGGTVPIGRPIAGARAYVLDRWLGLVGPGVVGELFVAGNGVARGYAGRPGLTAERFVPDPFVASERMYRTGDRVRRLPDGRLDFLGRADAQVKVRGFRVEPGELEGVLQSLPAVAEAVVVARSERADRSDARLLAYVVPAPGATPSERELRERVRQLVPEFMVPARVVVLEALPVTVNGKVDRAALPDPPPKAGEEAEPPRTTREREIAAIWSEILGRGAIARTDDFFDLGGNSLQALQILARLRETTGESLTLAQFFDRPSVAALAAGTAAVTA
jgi:amino acid adenylation domain-containing protein